MGTKQQADHSFVRVESARPITEPEHVDNSYGVCTTASTSSTAFKQQIYDQFVNARELAHGPVVLQLSFIVGPRRNWLNLWKQTIDTLDLILGRTRPDQPWNPRDGRIVEAGLHCTVDSSLGNDVIIEIAVSATG